MAKVIWTREKDNLILQSHDNVTLSERFGCNKKVIIHRRNMLMNKGEMEYQQKMKAEIALRSITSRPSFFEEDLDSLMRGNK